MTEKKFTTLEEAVDHISVEKIDGIIVGTFHLTQAGRDAYDVSKVKLDAEDELQKKEDGKIMSILKRIIGHGKS